MNNPIYTPKQLEVMRLWQSDQLKRLNILEGSVRSGKTWISLVLWAFWVAAMPRAANYLMVGKTITTLKRNCLELLTDLVGTTNFSYSLASKQGKLFGRKIYLEGANDSQSEGKIRGMTLQGAYCDELTLINEDFFTMLLSRLSMKGAKLIATTNPDSPHHWLYKDYISEERKDNLSLMTRKFLIDDNSFLDTEYVANLKNEYTGVYYERFILGQWVVAEGLIYPDAALGKYTVEREPEQETGRHYISVDYGTLNAFSAGLWAEMKDTTWRRIKEYYYSGREERETKTDEEYCDDIYRLADGKNILGVIIDPSAASFIAALRKRGKYAVRKANNAVIDGIRNTATAMKIGKITFTPECKATKSEFETYRWDEKANEDKPVEQNDHAMDDIRYFVNTIVAKRGGKFYD